MFVETVKFNTPLSSMETFDLGVSLYNMVTSM